jgi:hypothetical protein
MKCKHGLTIDTCSLCLGYKQTAPDDKGMKGHDNLVQVFSGNQRGNKQLKHGKEFYRLRKQTLDKADDYHEGGKKG